MVRCDKCCIRELVLTMVRCDKRCIRQLVPDNGEVWQTLYQRASYWWWWGVTNAVSESWLLIMVRCDKCCIRELVPDNGEVWQTLYQTASYWYWVRSHKHCVRCDKRYIRELVTENGEVWQTLSQRASSDSGEMWQMYLYRWHRPPEWPPPATAAGTGWWCSTRYVATLTRPHCGTQSQHWLLEGLR